MSFLNLDTHCRTCGKPNEQPSSRQVERHVRQGTDGERGVVFWRDIEDELPRERDFVLTYSRKLGVATACRISPYWKDSEITHWMPCPKPPKDV